MTNLTQEPHEERKTLVYILGLPFSGSTLFSLALGNDPKFFNAGEINYIENDFRGAARCSCGARLADCSFWGPIAEESIGLELRGAPVLRLEDKGQLHEVDERHPGLLRRLRLLANLPIDRVFSKASLADYAERHADFVDRLAARAGTGFVLDASKSARRLEILATFADTPLRVVVLRRNSRDVFAARIKRSRRRNRLYVQALSPFFAVWLVHLVLQTRRALRHFRAEQVITVGFPEFLERPRETERALSIWLGADIAIGVEGDRVPLTRVQHVFTGNRWIKNVRFGQEPLLIRDPAPDPLGLFERLTFRVTYALFPVLRRWDAMTLHDAP